MIMQNFDSKIPYNIMFLHDYHLAGEISTVRTSLYDKTWLNSITYNTS